MLLAYALAYIHILITYTLYILIYIILLYSHTLLYTMTDRLTTYILNLRYIHVFSPIATYLVIVIISVFRKRIMLCL